MKLNATIEMSEFNIDGPITVRGNNRGTHVVTHTGFDDGLVLRVFSHTKELSSAADEFHVVELHTPSHGDSVKLFLTRAYATELLEKLSAGLAETAEINDNLVTVV